MAQAHIAALLPTQNRVVAADTNTVFLAHYDLNEYDSLRDTKTVGDKNALQFSNAMVECPSFSMSSLSNLSTDAWVYWNGATGENVVYCQESVFEMKIDGGTGGSLMIAWMPYWGWIGDTTTAANKLTANTWNHVAATYDGTNQYLYLNGKLIYTRAQTGAINGNSYPFRIGARGSSGVPVSPFSGKIHNVRVWYKTLTAADVLRLMNTPPSADETGLRGWWKMNEGTGAVARDYSVFHNDAKITSATWTTGNSVFTLRDKEGYFGGSAIAVEESTTNLITNPAFISSTSSWSIGSWDTMQWINESNPMTGMNGCLQLVDGSSSATGFMSQNLSGVTFPLTLTTYFKIVTGDPTKIRTGGTVFYSDNSYDDYTWEPTGNLTYVGNNIYKVTKTISSTNSSKTFSYYQFRVSHTDSAASEIHVYACQAETKAYSTTFANPTRAVGNLLYMIPMAQNPFTISFWAKTEGWSGSYPWYINMYPSGAADGNNRIFFRPSDKVTIAAGRVVAGTIYITSNGTVSDISNGWHMYSLTSNGTAMSVYQDGNLVASGSAITDLPTGTNMLLELFQSNPTFNILIDELRIDNIARTDAEISAWYYSASPFWPRGLYRKPY